ncbi:MAG: ABC transporter transmembrane domain-containing protein [Rhodospirillales bacterium]
MKRSLYRYILAFSKREQIVLVVTALISHPILYITFELPKVIINDAIGAGPGSREVPYLGITVEQLEYLLLLCIALLVFVCINGGLKYFNNVYRGAMNERLLRRLRFILFHRILRFPVPQFRKLSQGEVVSMITAETEPVGGFFGDSIALPVYQGGILLTALGFIAVQDPIMGLIAVSTIPIQMYLIPKLQKIVNGLARERVRTVRQLSQQLGESVGGIYDVHTHDTSELESTRIGATLGEIYFIRLRIYIWKFLIKFVNNFLAQVTPIAFYLVGGYLVIAGDFTIGALTASIAAHKDLSAPWKELLGWYQRLADAQIKYDQLVEQFGAEGMLDEAVLTSDPDESVRLDGKIEASNLSLVDDEGVKLIENVNFSIEQPNRVVVTGPGGGGKAQLAHMLARVVTPTSGNLRISSHALFDLPESVTGRQIGYAGPESALFNASVRENILYGLQHRPLRDADYDDEQLAEWEKQRAEAEKSGNRPHDINADWIDLEAAGATTPEELTERLVEALAVVGLSDDIFQMGLQRQIHPGENDTLAEGVLLARKRLSTELEGPMLSTLVELFHVDRYNRNASLAENLLFGTPVGKELGTENLSRNPYVLDILGREGLRDDLTQAGLQIARTMVELFSDLPPGHEFFERYSFISADDLPDYQSVIRRAERDGIASLKDDDRAKLLSLPFQMTVARHRLGIVDENLERRILKARQAFRENLPDNLKPAVEFFDADAYNAAASIQDNILFGRLAYGRSEARERIGTLISDVIDEFGLRAAIMNVGLEASVGIAGGRLSGAQRQKIVLARAIVKRPQILIVNEALTSLDASDRRRVLEQLRNAFVGRTIIWFDNEVDPVGEFHRQFSMKSGRLTDEGEPEATAAPEPEEEAAAGDGLAEEVQLLRGLPLLSGLDRSTLKLIAFTSEKLTFEAGEEMFHQGDPGEDAYIVMDGAAEIWIDTEDGEEMLRQVKPNELIGEIALLADVPRSATVKVTSRLTALQLSKSQLINLIEQDRQIAVEMMRVLAFRLDDTTKRLLSR